MDLTLTSHNSATSSTARKTISKKDLKQLKKEFVGNRHRYLSKCGKYIYHVGIIDYLQDYNFEKKAENFYKQKIKGKGD